MAATRVLSLDSHRHFNKHLLYHKQNLTTPIFSHVESQQQEPEDPPPPPPSAAQKKRPFSAAEHARLQETMAESSSSSRRQNPTPPPPRPRLKGAGAGGGEIVEVQGGHIVRSTGRKDRHSKVCTAKGPRDRRVRLAAHTAIQFYDVQDRLGYDRPSKAVDWLIKKAKSAIDELAQLPPWHPTTQHHLSQEEQPHIGLNSDMVISNDSNTNQNSSFLPPSLDSDAIADTIKSFFPIGAPNSSSMQFDNFPTHDLLSRNSNSTTNNNNSQQDLRLSLQSFQDPILHHHTEQQTHSHSHSQAQVLLSGTPLGFDSWPPDHHQAAAELSRFQRLPSWNASGGESSSGGYLFNLPPPGALHQYLLGQNQFVSQRGPLQSSNSPAVRAWMDPPSSSSSGVIPIDHLYQQHPSVLPIYQPSISVGGFSGFHIPARIQGDEEERNGYHDKPSSASSDSRH